MARKRASLYTALTVAVMSASLLMTFKLIEFVPFEGQNEALLIRVPRLTTDTWAVFEPLTGAVRYGNNIDAARPIASVSKLFTAYSVSAFERLESTTTITWSDLNTEGETGKLTYGDTYTLGELLFPLLLESSNDAGASLARALGDDFSSVVALVIQSEGLKDTTIAEPTGLNSKNVSSPRDLAKFFAFVRRMHPHITDITRINMYESHGSWLVNNIPARALAAFTGGKHGFTPEAGKTFVGTFTLGDDRREIGIVLLGSSDTKADIESILASFR
jgi:serine-type D-Ala-D-Ala endopeptidase (penicillin-binding protein 7)